jgi:hypothetical protein
VNGSTWVTFVALSSEAAPNAASLLFAGWATATSHSVIKEISLKLKKAHQAA